MQPKLKWQCPRCDVSFQFFREEYLCTFIELHRVEHDLKDKGFSVEPEFEREQVRRVEEVEEKAVSELERAYPMIQNFRHLTGGGTETGRFWGLSNEDKNWLQDMKIAVD